MGIEPTGPLGFDNNASTHSRRDYHMNGSGHSHYYSKSSKNKSIDNTMDNSNNENNNNRGNSWTNSRAMIFLMVVNVLGMGYQIFYQSGTSGRGTSVMANTMMNTKRAVSEVTRNITTTVSVSSSSSSSQQAPQKIGWIRPDVVYGMIHMPKVAGTEINGILATKYERVCGNKGYSFDAHQSNKQAKESGTTNLLDVLLDRTGTKGSTDRNLVPAQKMLDRGFEDCDYIALEERPKFWEPLHRQLGPMELHVPCRDPIAHLMSMCNYVNNYFNRTRKFNCQASNLQDEIAWCDADMARMTRKFHQAKNVTLKCFNPMPPQRYITYMGTILQPKRIVSEYVRRETNEPRDKSQECVWNQSPQWKARLVAAMRRKWYYYSFCDKCLGSKDDLFFVVANKDDTTSNDDTAVANSGQPSQS